MQPVDLTKGDPAIAMQRAIASMRNADMLMTAKYQEQQTRALRKGAHPLILEFERKFVKRLASMGIPVFAHTVVRTRDEQASAFVRGVSKDSPADGLWPHRAFAVDIIHSNRGWNLTRDQWRVIGHIGKEVAASMQIEIEWGGDWKFYDPAHFELKNWRTIARNGDKFWSPRG